MDASGDPSSSPSVQIQLQPVPMGGGCIMKAFPQVPLLFRGKDSLCPSASADMEVTREGTRAGLHQWETGIAQLVHLFTLVQVCRSIQFTNTHIHGDLKKRHDSAPNSRSWGKDRECVCVCWGGSADIKNKRGRVTCSEMRQLIKCPLTLIVT